MNKFKFLFTLLAVVAMSFTAGAQLPKAVTYEGDPMHTQCYTLRNGMKVFLSVNNESPRITAHIAVRTGSRNDPAETTGLAHYLEHLMFKGTKQFGTSDAVKEAPYLDEIEARYEQYRKVTDPAKRKQLYHEIDSVSQIAAQYNIPNEYDKLMAGIGGIGTNAYTSTDVTCYTEDIPANEVDRWARIQSDRFRNMVIRGFHTELEAVYEEKNMGMAKDMWKLEEALYAKAFPGHPYGTQTTIGTQEHLKNPSITNIKNYYNNYYCPNNIAICMAGEMDPDKVIAILDKYFGDWQPNKNLTRPEFAPLKPIAAPVDTTILGQEAEFVTLAWRFDGGSSLQCDTLEVVSQMLRNGTAGLIDLNLDHPQRIMESGIYADVMTDYSLLMLMGYPNDGQSLDEVRDLFLGEIEKLRKGDFDDDLLTSVVNNFKLRYYRGLNNNRARTSALVNAFINGKEWKQEVGQLDRMSKMTKQQIVDFANKYLLDNYVCVYKRIGEDTSIKKIEKPAITPIPTNRDKQSDFVKNLMAETVEPIHPKFVDYNTDMNVSETKAGLPLLYKQNTDDDLFTLVYKYDFGKTADLRYDLALNYLDYLGTKTLTPQQFKQRMYKLACNFNATATDNHTFITISGLNENMPEAVALVEDLFKNATVDNEAYSRLVDMILKGRTDVKTNQDECFSRLMEYGQFGPNNSYTNILSEEQLRNTNPAELLELVNGLSNMQHTVVYFGPMSEKDFSASISKLHKTPKNLLDVPFGMDYMEQPTPETEILLAPYDAKNIYMVQYTNDERDWDPSHAAVISLFNEYFGTGMNGIVFQELREARGLAYSAAAIYNQPMRMGHKEDAYTYIATQNDKMMDCVDEFNKLIADIPQSEGAFNLAKESLLKKLASRRTTRYGVLQSYMAAQERGIDFDIYSKVYEELPKLYLFDIVDFEKETMAGKPYRYLILGDEKELDMERLEKIAPVRRVTLEDIFGY
ncbi:MAG: insulinase family protein [Muribaculaceae bacterium]|nr:insulinase family protein [Muribaculaceae bacterium]MBR5171390.1 insulinase family protein [Muribaculaceae bacterium]